MDIFELFNTGLTSLTPRSGDGCSESRYQKHPYITQMT